MDQSTLEFFFIDWEKPKATSDRTQLTELDDEEKKKLAAQAGDNPPNNLKGRAEEKKKMEELGDGTRNVRNELSGSVAHGETSSSRTNSTNSSVAGTSTCHLSSSCTE